MVRTLGAILGAVLLVSPAFAANPMSESALTARYCGGSGMTINIRMPDGTYSDCLSDTHIIEVDFSRKWAEAIGQALHYGLWTSDPLWSRDTIGPRRAGIILLCVSARDTCTDHYVRLFRIVEHFDLPVTIWDCDPRVDLALEDCIRTEGDETVSAGNSQSR